MQAGWEERTPWHAGGNPLVLAGAPRLAYQPIIDLGSGALLGFEALLRWHHPTEGIIQPTQLIPWAEANGDIVAIGEWVLMNSCDAAMQWPSSIQLAVNVSVFQLRRSAASAAVRAALTESGMAPDRLTIEVTERALSDDAAVADLRQISAMGVQLAVDDVGTSWNSFEVLRRLAVNTVKIDQSFVLALEPREGINRMVVESVVHLAHNCGMSTVAEGVETALHAAIVAEFDSDAAQGFFFAPPLTAEHATKMANLSGLRFPLVGSGWQDDDDWPIPAASLHQEVDDFSPDPAVEDLAPLEVAVEVEIDAIDMVDLVLSGPLHAPAHAAAPSRSDAGSERSNGASSNGASSNGASSNGASSNGASSNGASSNGRRHEVAGGSGDPQARTPDKDAADPEAAANDDPTPIKRPSTPAKRPPSPAKGSTTKTSGTRSKAPGKAKGGTRGAASSSAKPARTRRPTNKGGPDA